MTIITRSAAERKRQEISDIDRRVAQLMDDASNAEAMSKVADLISKQNSLEYEVNAYERSASARYDQHFDTSGNAYIHIPESLSSTVIMRLAKRASHTMEIPLGTVFLSLMSGAAAAVATNYATQFITGTRVPAVLHVACEHPPSTGKSNLVSTAINPYMAAMIKHNKRISGINRKRISDDKDASRLPHGFVFKTDATAAAIDAELVSTDSGRLVIASSEQAAFQSLFPEVGSFSSNNSLMLNGWMGEYVEGSRTTRKAYTGNVQSSVLLIAQVGSIQRVLSASNQTGLAERFLFAVEPDKLGNRTRANGYLSNDDKAAFNLASAECVRRYSQRVRVDEDDSEKLIIETDIQDLECLYPNNEGYEIIRRKLVEIEPVLGELRKSGEMTYLGWLGKLETHVLKIALVLHVFDCLGNGCVVPQVIPNSLIKSSIELVLEIGKHMRRVIQQSGEAGDSAEVDAVLDLVNTQRVNITEAKRILRRRAPFRSRGSDAYKAAGLRVDSMLREGLLVVSTDDGALKAI